MKKKRKLENGGNLQKKRIKKKSNFKFQNNNTKNKDEIRKETECPGELPFSFLRILACFLISFNVIQLRPFKLAKDSFYFNFPSGL